MSLDYFTEAELRMLPDVASEEKYPSARLVAAGEWIQAVIEREVGTSFVAREQTVTVSGNDQDSDGGIRLPTPWVLDVTAVKQSGVALTAPELAQVTVDAGIAIRQPSTSGFIAWELGVRNLEFTLDTGYSATPPPDVKDAALQGARYRAMRTGTGVGVSERATALSNEFGNIQLSTAGKDHPTGLPDVDAVIVGWRDKLNVFGFA